MTKQADKVNWLYNRFCAQAEIMEYSGARIMKVEDNFQRAMGGVVEELEMRPTREQINSQLVA